MRYSRKHWIPLAVKLGSRAPAVLEVCSSTYYSAHTCEEWASFEICYEPGSIVWTGEWTHLEHRAGTPYSRIPARPFRRRVAVNPSSLRDVGFFRAVLGNDRQQHLGQRPSAPLCPEHPEVKLKRCKETISMDISDGDGDE